MLLVVDDDGNCPVLDQLCELNAGNKQAAGLAKRMRYRLERDVPSRVAGPHYHNEEIAKHLRDDIYEFKRDQNRGPGLRVLWFYGSNRQVICTSSFLKRDKTPEIEIDRAIAIRKQFLDDETNGRIDIVDLKP